MLTFRLDVNVFGVGFLSKLLHTEYARIVIKIVEHVSILISA